MEDVGKRLITRNEAAKILRVHPQTISNYIDEGIIKSKKVGNQIMIDSDTIYSLLDTYEDVSNIYLSANIYKQKLLNLKENYEKELKEWMTNVGCLKNGSPSRFRELIINIASLISERILSKEEFVIFSDFIRGVSYGELAQRENMSYESVRSIIIKAIDKIGILKNYDDVINENEKLHHKIIQLEGLCNIQKEYLDKDETLSKEETEWYDNDDIQTLELLKTKVIDLNFSVRSLNVLKAMDIITIGQLVKYNRADVLKWRCVGEKTVKEMEKLLFSFGLTFGMDITRYKKIEMELLKKDLNK